MAVISVTTLTVKPDKYEAFLDQNRKAKTILERCGAKNVRLMGTIVAGEASGTLAMTGKPTTTRATERSWTSSWLILTAWRCSCSPTRRMVRPRPSKAPSGETSTSSFARLASMHDRERPRTARTLPPSSRSGSRAAPPDGGGRRVHAPSSVPRAVGISPASSARRHRRPRSRRAAA
jgi:hypothetical protein